MSFTKNYDSWQPNPQPTYHQAQYGVEPLQTQASYSQPVAYQNYPPQAHQYDSQSTGPTNQAASKLPFNPLSSSLRRIVPNNEAQQGNPRSARHATPQSGYQNQQVQAGANFQGQNQYNRRSSYQPEQSPAQPQGQNNLMANLFGNFKQEDFKNIYAKLIEPKTDFSQQVCTKYGKQTIVHSDLDDPNLYEDVHPEDYRVSSLLAKPQSQQDDDEEIVLNHSPKKIMSSGAKLNKAGLGNNYGAQQAQEINLPFGRSQTLKDQQQTDQMNLNWIPLKEIASHFIDNKETVKPIQDIVPEELYENYDKTDEVRNSLGQYAYVDYEFTLDTNIADTQKYTTIDPYPIPWKEHNYRWQHLTEIEYQTGIKYKIYDDNIHPNDIVQGKLGSCFFLSAISALAERPALVKRLFEGPDLHASGAQKVWLNIMGVWKPIIIDDFYPTDSYTGKLAFAHSRDNMLWVSMLEKAYAKAYGSFQAIDGGRAEDALKDLTGAPYSYFKEELKTRSDLLWSLVDRYDRSGYLMVTGIDIKQGQGDDIQGQSEKKYSNGLVAGHAYSLISAQQVTGSDNKSYRIVQIRNPWGHTEWTGLWSDNCRLWTRELREKLASQAANDGSFWMRWEDFCKEFDDLGVCKVDPDFLYNYKVEKVTFDCQTKSLAFVVHVKTNGKYYFSIDHKNCKVFFEQGNPLTRIQILKVENDRVILKGMNAGMDRNQNVSVNLMPGTYIALIDVTLSEFPAPYVPSRKITFSSYGVDTTSIKPIYLSKKEMIILETLTLSKTLSTVTEGWKKNKQGCTVGRSQMYTYVLPYKDGALRCNKQFFEPEDQQMSYAAIQIETDPRSAHQSKDNDSIFYMDLGDNPVCYTKNNDTSTKMKPQIGQPQLLNQVSNDQLYSIIGKIFQVQSDFPVVNTSDQNEEVAVQNELDEEAMSPKRGTNPQAASKPQTSNAASWNNQQNSYSASPQQAQTGEQYHNDWQAGAGVLNTAANAGQWYPDYPSTNQNTTTAASNWPSSSKVAPQTDNYHAYGDYSASQQSNWQTPSDQSGWIYGTNAQLNQPNKTNWNY